MQQLKITQSVTVRNLTVNQYLADINKYPMVTPDEETELAIRIQQGDKSATALISVTSSMTATSA